MYNEFSRDFNGSRLELRGFTVFYLGFTDQWDVNGGLMEVNSQQWGF